MDGDFKIIISAGFTEQLYVGIVQLLILITVCFRNDGLVSHINLYMLHSLFLKNTTIMRTTLKEKVLYRCSM